MGRKLRTFYVRCRCSSVMSSYPHTHIPSGEEILEITCESGRKGFSEGGRRKGKTKAQFFSHLAHKWWMALSCALIKGPLYYSAARNTSEKTVCCLKKSLGWIQHWNMALTATSGSPARAGRLDTPFLSQFFFLSTKAWNYFKMLQIWLCHRSWKSNFEQMGALVDRQPRELLPTGWGCRRWDCEALRQNGSRLLHQLLFPSVERPTYRKKPCLGSREFSSPAWHRSAG